MLLVLLCLTLITEKICLFLHFYSITHLKWYFASICTEFHYDFFKKKRASANKDAETLFLYFIH